MTLLLGIPCLTALAYAQSGEGVVKELACATAQVTDQGDATDPNSLASIITPPPQEPLTVVLPGCSEPYTFRTCDFYVPQTVTLKIDNGARIRTEGECGVLDIRGPIEARNYQIIDYEMDETQQPSRISKISLRMREASNEEAPALFEWWGARGDGSTDSGPFIEEAATASRSIKGSSGANYLVKAPIRVPSHTTIDGNEATITAPIPAQLENKIFAIFEISEEGVQIEDITIKNFIGRMNGAERFAYISGASGVTLDSLDIKIDPEVAVTGEYWCIDIRNSQHCTLSRLQVHGGGKSGIEQNNPPSVGIYVRSDESGGFPELSEILIKDSVLLCSLTNVLLDCDRPSSTIRLQNVSLKGTSEIPGEHGSLYGIRSIGSNRADVSMESIHMESLTRAVSFEPSSSPDGGQQGTYYLSVKNARFSNIEEAFNLYKLDGTPSNTVNLELVDLRGEHQGVFLAHVDATVTVKGELALGQPGSGSGTVLYPNRPYKVEIHKLDPLVNADADSIMDVYIASDDVQAENFCTTWTWSKDPRILEWCHIVQYIADYNRPVNNTAYCLDSSGVRMISCPSY